jgi:hypothetical protein
MDAGVICVAPNADGSIFERPAFVSIGLPEPGNKLQKLANWQARPANPTLRPRPLRRLIPAIQVCGRKSPLLPSDSGRCRVVSARN